MAAYGAAGWSFTRATLPATRQHFLYLTPEPQKHTSFGLRARSPGSYAIGIACLLGLWPACYGSRGPSCTLPAYKPRRQRWSSLAAAPPCHCYEGHQLGAWRRDCRWAGMWGEAVLAAAEAAAAVPAGGVRGLKPLGYRQAS